MKGTMKKLLCTVLVMTMLVLMVACSTSNNDESTNDEQQTPQQPAENDGSSNGNDAPKPITITFAEHVANIEVQSPHVAAIVKTFMDKNSNVTIDMTGTEVNEHQTKMKMAAQADNLPDIIWFEAPLAREMVAEGYLADLTPHIDERNMRDFFLGGMIDACTVDGKIYGLPSEPLGCGLWYNKAIFEEYNVKVPKTYEDFLDAIEMFAKNDVVPIAKGAKSPFSVWSFQAMLARYGFFEKYDDLMTGNESFVNPDFIKFYEKVDEMRELGAFPANVATLDYFQAVEMFMGGKAAMLDAGAWETSKLEKSDIAKDIGFWWGPTFSDGVGNQEVGIKAPGGPYVVSAKAAKDPDKMKVIMDFFEFFYGPEGTKIIVEDNQILPTTKYDGKVDPEKYPVFAAMLEAMNDDFTGVPEPFAALPTATGQALFDSIYGVINGIYTPQEAAKLVEDTLARERQ
jgi:raffinose/stachyose/melibiose transport system substrate-binding protein